jgi:RimJ/RimL family protein N-acetyltransferase
MEFQIPDEITGKLVVLKKMRPKYLNKVKMVFENPLVNQFLTHDKKEFSKSLFLNQLSLIYVLITNTNQVIGWVGIRNIKNTNCSIEIALSPEFWGLGYSQDAIVTLEYILQYKLKLTSIYAYIRKENKRSLSFFKNKGYTVIVDRSTKKKICLHKRLG